MRPRLGQPGPYGLRATLLSAGESTPADLVGVSYAQIDITAPRLGLREGDHVVVGLFADGMADVVTSAALVRSAFDRPAGSRYALQILDPERLNLALPLRAQAAFNRRSAFRVIPDTKEPISSVLVRAEGSPVLSTPVISVSISGIAVLGKSRDLVLAPGERVQVEFEVPETGRRVKLAGNVRYAIPGPAGTRYGVMFDANATPDFARQQKVLSQYVMALQRRMLRVGE